MLLWSKDKIYILDTKYEIQWGVTIDGELTDSRRAGHMIEL